jgi:hypothetical protein
MKNVTIMTNVDKLKISEPLRNLTPAIYWLTEALLQAVDSDRNFITATVCDNSSIWIEIWNPENGRC